MRKAVNKKLVANLLTVASDLIAKYWKSDVTLSAKEWKCKSGYFFIDVKTNCNSKIPPVSLPDLAEVLFMLVF